jgi:acyl-CoA thioester hydrolase
MSEPKSQPPTAPAPPSSGWLDGQTHCLPVRVYYEDTDFTGMVYHANHLRYFERGRSDFLRLIGVSHTALLGRDDPAAFAITRLVVDYRKPARIDEELVVRTRFNTNRGIRLQISQSIVRGEALIAEAEVEAVFIGLSGKPHRPPKALIDALLPWVLSPAP